MIDSNYPDWTPELVLEDIYPPIIRSKDEYYNFVVLGGKWYVAPKNVTLEMVRTQWKHPYRDINSTTTLVPTIKSFEVLSSNGKDYYTVTIQGSYNSCTCPGFGFRGYCKHVKQFLQE
jgi:hypothetical protein